MKQKAPSLSSFKHLLTFLVITCLLTEIQSATNITGLSISSSPTTIATSATVTFSFNIDSNLTSGFINFTIPSPGAFTASTTLTKCTTTLTTITITACTITAQTARFDYTVTSGANVTSLILKAANFINPSSTTAITGVSVGYYSSSNSLKGNLTSQTFSGFTAATMTIPATLTPTSTVIGATTTATIAFTTVNGLATTGILMVVFPAYSSTKSFIASSTPTCVGVTTLKTSLTCTFVSSNNTLILYNILSTSKTTVSSMSFTVDNVRNPYSAIPRTGISIYTCDSNYGYIDSYTSITFTVTTMATLTNPSISRTDGITTVGESSIIQAYFEMGSMPVDANCRLRIDFPSDMPLTSALTSVSGTGMFASTTSFQTLSTASDYLEVNGCPTAEDPANTALVFLTSVVNKAYVQTTSTFKFSLYSIVGSTYYNIASQTTSLTFSDFTTGNITTFSVTPVNSSTVQAATQFQITMQPQHNISTSSKIVITFPSTITLTNGTCTLSSTSGSISSSPGSCVQLASTNTITITNPFGSSSYTAGSAFSFVLSKGTSAGTNPTSQQSIGTFTVNTYSVVSSVAYSIDSGTFTNLYSVTAGALTASVSVDSTVACTQNSTYTFALTTAKTIPASGKVSITFPSTISLTNSAITSCKIIVSGTTTTLSTCSVSSTSPVTVLVPAFNSSFSIGTISVVLSGFTNPISLSNSASFSISTTDSSGNTIETVSSGLTVQMSSFSHLTSFIPTLSSSTNAATGGSINIAITVTCPLSTGSIVYFTVPAEIGVSNSTACAKFSGTGLTSVFCDPTSNAISATLTLSSSLATGSVFSFNVTNITNPATNCSTSAFTGMSIYDSSGNQVNAYTGTTVTVQTTTPVNSSGSLSQGSILTSASTNYTLTYTTANALAVGTRFQITYPSIITVPSTLTYCVVASGNVTYSMTCTPNTSLRTININSSTGTNSIIASNSTIKVTIGPITNPNVEVSNPASLTFTAYQDASLTCALEGTTTGLTLQFACNYPCMNCSQSNKSSCSACNLADPYGNFYLYNSNCTSSCPSTGYFADSNKQCQNCSSECLTCSNGSTCATCNTTGTYKYLYNSDCLSSCPSGYYAASNYSCLKCNSSCLTCNSSSTSCLSCNTSAGAAYPFLLNSTCLASCPTGYLTSSGSCKQCTSPCSTCTNSVTQCSSCISKYFMYDSTCVSSCPTGSVANSSSTCIDCSTGCGTCNATKPSTCYSCKTGYLFYNNTCVSSCPTGTYSNGSYCLACNASCQTCTGPFISNCTSCNSLSPFPYLYSTTCVPQCPTSYVSVSGTCQQCTSPCTNCSTSTTTCTACSSSNYLYQSTCVSSCPSGTGIQYSSNSCVTTASNCKVEVSTDASLCSQCKVLYNLYNQTCVKSCPSNSYKIDSSDCGMCDTSCATCTGASSSECSTCSASYPISYNGSCLASCPTGYTYSAGTCSICSSPCSNCTSTSTQCTSCITGYNLYSSTCVKTCPSNTVAISAVCTSCASSCLSCSSLNTSKCLSCATGSYLYNGTCVSSCPAGTFLNGSSCLSCDTSCLTCNGTGSSNCLTCNSSSTKNLLQSTSCVSSCSTGYVKNSTTSSCQQCSANCSSCSGNTTNCSSCITGYSLSSGKCSQIQCLTTQYLSGSTCLSCNSNCLTCSTTNSNCLSCNHTGSYPILQSNSCISSCASGYAAVNYTCQQCKLQSFPLIPSIGTYPGTTCSLSTTNYTSCLSPYVLASVGTCSLCADGTYYKSSACATCNTNCMTCAGAASYCLSCDISSSNPYLMSNQCVTSCPTGYTPIDYECVQCKSPCLTCSIESTYCSTCIPGYFMYLGTCVSTCPAGSVYSNSGCVLCDQNCDTCSSSDTGVCTECSSGYYLYSDNCYKVCPNGYSPDKATKTTCVPAWYKINVIANTSETTTNSSSSSVIQHKNNSTYNPNETPGYNSSTSLNETNKYDQDGAVEIIVANQSTLVTTTQAKHQAISSQIESDSQLEIQFYIVTSILIVLALAITLLGHYKDSKSKILTNLIVFLSPIELLVYSYQAYHLNLTMNTSQTQIILFYSVIVALTNLYIMNVTSVICYRKILIKDEAFRVYSKQHSKVTVYIMTLTTLISFKIMKLFSSRLFGLSQFNAQVKLYSKWQKCSIWFTFLNMLLTLVPILAIDIYGLNRFSTNEGSFYLSFFLVLFMIVISLLDMRNSLKVQANAEGDSSDIYNDVKADDMTVMEESQKIQFRTGTDDRLKEQNDSTFNYAYRDEIQIKDANEGLERHQEADLDSEKHTKTD